jgi:heptosyltransferase-1
MPEADSPQRILIVRPSALGDVARTVPCLATLRRAYPQAVIDWVVNDTFIDAVRAHPDLSEAIPFPRTRFRKFGRNWAVSREVLGYLADLRKRDYDLVYDLQGLSRSGVLSFATRAPRRVGFADARESAWLGYNHWTQVKSIHTVDRMIDLLAGDGLDPVRDMRLYTPPEAGTWAEQWLKSHELSDQRYAVIAPTAKWASKRWPAERYAAVADRLPKVGVQAAVVVAGPHEREQVEPLLNRASAVRLIDAVGQTSVGQLMALIERSDLAICNDSAALHIAVGFGRRCVGIFGPTDPQRVGPYRYDVGVVAASDAGRVNYRASSTDDSLIRSITVDQVWGRVEKVVQSPPPPLA